MGPHHRNQRKQEAPPAQLAHLSARQAAIIMPAVHLTPPPDRQQLAGQIKVRERERDAINASIAHLKAQLATT